MAWYRKRILKQRWKTETLFFWNAWDQCFLPEMLATFSSAHLRIVWEDINEPSLSKNNFSEGNTLLSFSLSFSLKSKFGFCQSLSAEANSKVWQRQQRREGEGKCGKSDRRDPPRPCKRFTRFSRLSELHSSRFVERGRLTCSFLTNNR